MIWLDSYQPSAISAACFDELDTELFFIVRTLLGEARSYARARKRVRLGAVDLQIALDSRHVRRTRERGKRDDREEEAVVSLTSLIDRVDASPSTVDRLELTMHWLAIDGEQPITSANPLPTFSEYATYPGKARATREVPAQLADQSPMLRELFQVAVSIQLSSRTELQEHIHPLTKNNLTMKPVQPANVTTRRSHLSDRTPVISVPQLSLAHELSREQQRYFDSLTKACLSNIDEDHPSALSSLSSDAALQPLLPRLLLFISRGIERNVHFHDVNLLRRLLSMAEMLIKNPFLVFDKYLHMIVPSLLTCLTCVFDQPCGSTELVYAIDHSIIWSLREQASDLICCFTRRFPRLTHLVDRITSVLHASLVDQNGKATFSVVYIAMRTLLAIDARSHRQLLIAFRRESNTTSVLEVDFDLDRTAQRALFDRKMTNLFG